MSRPQRYIPQCIDQSFSSPRPVASSWFLERVEVFSTWPEPETVPEEEYLDNAVDFSDLLSLTYDTAKHAGQNQRDQDALLLHAAKQRYAYTRCPVPELKDEREMLVEVQAIGLNPIDWKAPDFGFGLPSLPCISGRDLAGKVVRSTKSKSRFKVGDTVRFDISSHDCSFIKEAVTDFFHAPTRLLEFQQITETQGNLHFSNLPS